ncbi:MAG: DUF3987 domain-containing protein [Hyphomicrobiaceae bacterium]|nr:MAG: DUF3987 domain-containing protein [Hyphomicrobiaceae bacterium]
MTVNGSQDFIGLFLEYTDGIPSPEIFRLWAAIATVAGALERRVWVETARNKLYPNLFTLLVAPPAVGKSQAIIRTHELWYSVKDLKVAPDNVTKPALMDRLQKSSRKMVLSETGLFEYHSLLVAAPEFGVLVPAHDLEFLNVLNHIFDCPTSYREERRSLGDKQIDIVGPQLNILAGTQPAYLANLLPEEAWGMGFMSRLIMVYSSEKVNVPLFAKYQDNIEVFKKMNSILRNMAKLYGAMEFSPEAQTAIEGWVHDGCEPVPAHSKLAHYNGRRILHLLKLSIIAAVSAGNSSIGLKDYLRAREWLLRAEQTMPDIFREMVGKSDTQVIDELHYYCWQIWIKEKRPVHKSRLVHFLHHRVPSEKVQRIVDIAEQANILERMAGTDTYRPRPKHEHGLE